MLAVIKAITLLDKLTDRSDKDKIEDTEATIHVSESVCIALHESPYPGPARTCPQSWRVNYRKKCLSLFMQTAGFHDEMSVRCVCVACALRVRCGGVGVRVGVCDLDRWVCVCVCVCMIYDL